MRISSFIARCEDKTIAAAKAAQPHVQSAARSAADHAVRGAQATTKAAAHATYRLGLRLMRVSKDHL